MSLVAANAASGPAADDARFMRLAFQLGRRQLGNTWPNPAVGAVVVKDGIIVGRGWTQAGGRPHAETEALRRAREHAKGSTLYVTLEPCSHHGKTRPCADAIIKAGVARVVSALEDPNPEVAGNGHRRLIERGIKVEVGLFADDALRAHAGHIRRVRDARPHVLLKLAVSADGKAGLSGRKPAAITGDAARTRVFQLRAESDAILVGIGTVLSDDPALTCRMPGMFERSPVRVVLDSDLRAPLSRGVVATVRETPTWVFASRPASKKAEEVLRDKGVEVFRVGGRKGRLDLAQVLKTLARRGITRLMVEGGPMVAAAFVDADLVDAFALFRGPKVIGGEGIDAIEDRSLDEVTQAMRALDSEELGDDSLAYFERA